jgi:hypothetical protein
LNINLSNAKVPDLPSLFKDKTDQGTSEIAIETIEKFWGTMTLDSKNHLVEEFRRKQREV